MKKIFAFLLIVAITISVSVCLANDSLVAKEVNYPATIINPNGANYYIASGDEEIVGGTLARGEKITIYYESENEDDSLVFYLLTSGDTAENKWKKEKRINKSDFRTDAKPFNPKNSAGIQANIKIVSPNGAKLYPNPSLAYESKGIVKPGEVLDAKQLTNYSDGNWFYIKSLEGYIHIVNYNAGYTSTETIFTPTEVNLYDTMSINGKVLLKIQPNVYFEDYIRFNKEWYYVSVYGYDGYINYNDIARKSHGETSVVWYENTNLYSEASFNSIKLYNDIPVNTVLEWEYDTCIDEYGWVKTNYKKLTGWVFTINPNLIYDDSEYSAIIRESYFDMLTYGEGKGIVTEQIISDAEENKENILENTNVPISKETEDRINESNNKNENENKISNENNVSESNKEEHIKHEEKPSTNDIEEWLTTPNIIIVCCGCVILILIIIIIKLVKKNAGYKRRY